MSDALEAIFSLAKRSNKYIDETMPWALAKDESKKERLGTVLYNLLESIRFISVLISPFMPETAEKIMQQMNCSVNSYDSLSSFGALEAGTSVGEAKPLFGRIDAEKMFAEIEKRHIAKEDAEKKEEKKEIAGLAKIGIDDFAKVEIRVGKVLDCENVKRSNKLLKFTIDDGSKEPRTIVSGIAKWYKPEELKGKNIVFVANLKPVKLCGVESNGMILSAECSEDDVKVLTVDESIPAGSVIG